MKNSFNEVYTLWLRQYHSSNKGSNAQHLIEEISKITTIEMLIELFSHHLEPEVAQYGAINFYSQLSSWKRELEKIVVDQQQAIAELSKLAVTTENKKLIMLLNEIMSEPKLLLHIRIPSLLGTLCSGSLPELIDYIVHLPKAAPPLNPRPGSFAAQVPQSRQHAACLTLLNNVSSAMNERNPLWNNANTLLQSSLLIYQELDLVEVSLDDEKSIEKTTEINTKKESSCTFM